MLKEILPLIQKVSEGQDLTAEESKKAFSELIRNDLESYYFFTFTIALHTKRETSDELLGLYRAFRSLLPKIKVNIEPHNIMDVSGTGGDKIKTLNVSTACAFIVASLGIVVAKPSFWAVTGITGSADLLRAFGIDVVEISKRGPQNIKEIAEKIGVVTYLDAFLADPKKSIGLQKWPEKRKEIGLNYITAFHLAANLCNSIPVKRRIYGVFDKKHTKVLIELLQKLNYKKALVFSGDDGLDEISNIGPTIIYELSKNKIKNYTLTPEDFGVKIADIEDIKAVDREGNIADFLMVLYGKEKGPKRDLVCINAGAAFYVMDKVPNFKKGTKLAKSLIDSGKASSKFEEYVKYCGDINKLNKWKEKTRL